MAISAAHLSGLPGPVSAEAYVFRLLMDRAISKLDRTEVESVLRTASRALANAGKWTDDVRITVNTKRAFQAGRQCVRMLHGVPSPRMWVGQARTSHRWPRKTRSTFLSPSKRTVEICCSAPFPNSRVLKRWLTGFFRSAQHDSRSNWCKRWWVTWRPLCSNAGQAKASPWLTARSRCLGPKLTGWPGSLGSVR